MPKNKDEFRNKLLENMSVLEAGELPAFLQSRPLYDHYYKGLSKTPPLSGNQAALFRLPWLDDYLGVQVAYPAPEIVPRGIILFFHGYQTHNGNFAPFFSRLLERGFIVVASDLPGHGLTGGAIRGSVNDFSEYGEAAASLVNWVKSIPEWETLPLIASGHSTGCLAFTDYLSRYDNPFSALIFGAPLVRIVHWNLVLTGHFLMSGLVKNFDVNNNDLLGLDVFPVSWLSGLISWNDRVINFPPVHVPLLIIQGDLDDVVDWRYNLPVLQKIFPFSTQSLHIGRKHTILQMDNIMDAMFNSIDFFLGLLPQTQLPKPLSKALQ